MSGVNKIFWEIWRKLKNDSIAVEIMPMDTYERDGVQPPHDFRPTIAKASAAPAIRAGNPAWVGGGVWIGVAHCVPVFSRSVVAFANPGQGSE